jgi:hypothetical protein
MAESRGVNDIFPAILAIIQNVTKTPSLWQKWAMPSLQHNG